MLISLYSLSRNLSQIILLLPLMFTEAFAAAGGIPGAPGGGGGGAPNINQCKTKWTMTPGPALAFGAFSIDSGSGTLTMNNANMVSASGPNINLSTSLPTTNFTVTLNNTKSPLCSTYGFTINATVAPSELTAAGATMPLTLLMSESTIPITATDVTSLPITLSPPNLPITLIFQGSITATFPQLEGSYTSPVITVDLTQSGTTVSVTGTATATSRQPITLLETTPMDFGTVASGSLGGTVILDTLGARTVTGDAQILAIGPGTAGEFEITGSPGLTYLVTITGPAVLENALGDQISASIFTNNGTGTLPAATGIELFQVGATLTLAPSQPGGAYSTAIGGGIPYAVTVNYN